MGRRTGSSPQTFTIKSLLESTYINSGTRQCPLSHYSAASAYFKLPGTDFMILLEFWLFTGVVAGRITRMLFTTFQTSY